ncbi:MAG: hypothetical protein ACT6FG_01210 [Methanosarcinaceae archaeon]
MGGRGCMIGGQCEFARNKGESVLDLGWLTVQGVAYVMVVEAIDIAVN